MERVYEGSVVKEIVFQISLDTEFDEEVVQRFFDVLTLLPNKDVVLLRDQGAFEWSEDGDYIIHIDGFIGNQNENGYMTYSDEDLRRIAEVFECMQGLQGDDGVSECNVMLMTDNEEVSYSLQKEELLFI